MVSETAEKILQVAEGGSISKDVHDKSYLMGFRDAFATLFLYWDKVKAMDKILKEVENELQKKIIDYLTVKSGTSSSMMQELKLVPAEVNRELTMMEVKGVVRRCGEEWVL